MKRILIATDGSPHAREALEVGLELAAEAGGEATAVHVLTPLDSPAGDEGVPGVPHRLTTPEDDPALAPALEAAAARGVPCRAELLVGAPAEEILALAAEWEADLVVLGSRGLGALRGALLGSVSREVLDRARLPVLVVKSAPAPAEAEGT